MLSFLPSFIIIIFFIISIIIIIIFIISVIIIIIIIIIICFWIMLLVLTQGISPSISSMISAYYIALWLLETGEEGGRAELPGNQSTARIHTHLACGYFYNVRL